jgi:hypothetical protein
VKPYEMVSARRKTEEDPVLSDKERRHQELLAAVGSINH